MDDLERCLDLAAARLSKPERLLIGTGAGMSVDSGIAAYREPGQSAWRDYGSTGGVRAEDLACPRALEETPALAWGFLERTRRRAASAVPHAGYDALARLAARAGESFLQTTNVDGLHRRAGWPTERLHEVHGSLWRLQCSGPCSRRAWADERVPLCDLDADGDHARSWPRCPSCGRAARPHALLFADLDYVGDPGAEQARRTFHQAGPDVALVVGESGVIPTHSHDAEALRREHGTFVIDVNPDGARRGARVADVHVPLGALDGLQRLLERVER